MALTKRIVPRARSNVRDNNVRLARSAPVDTTNAGNELEDERAYLQSVIAGERRMRHWARAKRIRMR